MLLPRALTSGAIARATVFLLLENPGQRRAGSSAVTIERFEVRVLWIGSIGVICFASWDLPVDSVVCLPPDS